MTFKYRRAARLYLARLKSRAFLAESNDTFFVLHDGGNAESFERELLLAAKDSPTFQINFKPEGALKESLDAIFI